MGATRPSPLVLCIHVLCTAPSSTSCPAPAVWAYADTNRNRRTMQPSWASSERCHCWRPVSHLWSPTVVFSQISHPRLRQAAGHTPQNLPGGTQRGFGDPPGGDPSRPWSRCQGSSPPGPEVLLGARGSPLAAGCTRCLRSCPGHHWKEPGSIFMCLYPPLRMYHSVFPLSVTCCLTHWPFFKCEIASDSNPCFSFVLNKSSLL